MKEGREEGFEARFGVGVWFAPEGRNLEARGRLAPLRDCSATRPRHPEAAAGRTPHSPFGELS